MKCIVRFTCTQSCGLVTKTELRLICIRGARSRPETCCLSHRQQNKPQADKKVPQAWIPAYPAEGGPWEIGVLPGPNAAPDYFTDEDIQTLYSATYTVHYNS